MTANRWKQVLVHELFEYFFNFAFLAFFLVAFAWYRRLILEGYHIQDHGYWIPLIEAAILAKVIMIGDALHVGRKLRDKPLAMVAVYRAVVFSLFTVLFSFLEHIVVAWLHGKPASDGIAEILNKGLYELLAQCVLVFAAFVPFFAVKELEGVFGVQTVRELLFQGAKGRAVKP